MRTIGAGAHPITGTPADGVPSYQIGASMNISAAGYGAALDLYVTPGTAAPHRRRRRLLHEPVRISTVAADRARLPTDDHHPGGFPVRRRGRRVRGRSPWRDEGHLDSPRRRTDEMTATGTLYGPFDEQPTEADTPPAGTSVAGTETMTLTGPGSYTSPGTIIAPESGFYTWVWAIDKAAHGEHAKYLTDSFTDRFGQVAETSVVPSSPTRSPGRPASGVPGDVVTDTITVSSTNGAWLKKDGDTCR